MVQSAARGTCAGGLMPDAALSINTRGPCLPLPRVWADSAGPHAPPPVASYLPPAPEP